MVIFSGIQPTGRKHLGNYIGAILQYVEGQDRGDPAIYCIVDLHATTVAYEPAELRERSRDTAALLVASGLDPERCILFRQSDVPEHTELTWLLSSVTSVGAAQPHAPVPRQVGRSSASWCRAGLLFYPVLMAADVLAYRAHEVPVGEDQREHIELMRDVAADFNERFGDDAGRARGQHPRRSARACATSRSPTRKMSTTGGTPSRAPSTSTRSPTRSGKKFKRAVTDSGREIVRARRQARHHEPDRDPRRRARRRARSAIERDFDGSGYGDFKTAVGDEVAAWLAPVRERYLRAAPGRRRALEDDPGGRRREGAGDRGAASWPTCATRWASARPSDGPPPSLSGRVAIAQPRAGPRRLRGAVRPAALADPARGARPAGGRAGRGRHRLPRPPGGARRARPRGGDRVPRPDRGAAGAQVAADAAGRGASRSSTSWRPPRRPRSWSSGCSSTRASAARARIWPSATTTARRCLLPLARRRPRAAHGRRWPREAAYDPAVLGAALGALLRTPPPIDLAHMATPRVTVGRAPGVLRDAAAARHASRFDEAVKDADRVTVA